MVVTDKSLALDVAMLAVAVMLILWLFTRGTKD